jgi:F-box interacting protein
MEVPQDITFEIFSRLPAKSICKFKSTCDSKFFEEITFKTKQAHNLLRRDDTCFFIQPEQIRQRYEKRVELHSLSKEQQSSGIPNNVLTFLSNSACVLASSNGLVLCHTINNDQLDLFVCNPITKSWSFIPTPKSLQTCYNFANINLMLDCSRGSLDDYSVFLFENTMEFSPNSYICNVYHGKEGVWETMERCFFPGGRNMKFDMPVFHNGAVHFISDSGLYFERSSPFYKAYIMSYNLEDGTSTMLELPREVTKDCHAMSMCNMGIFNWGKVTGSIRSICLVILSKSVFTIWVLEDYESASWQKVSKVRVKELGLKEKDADVTGFTVMNGDLLVFSTEEKIYSCGLDDGRFPMVEEICKHNCGSMPRFISYSDTLRSCGVNAETMPC